MPDDDPIPTLDYATPPRVRLMNRRWWGLAVFFWVVWFGVPVFCATVLTIDDVLRLPLLIWHLDIVVPAVVAVAAGIVSRRWLVAIKAQDVLAIDAVLFFAWLVLLRLLETVDFFLPWDSFVHTGFGLVAVALCRLAQRR